MSDFKFSGGNWELKADKACHEVSIENGDEFTDVTFYGSRACNYANLFNASADMYAEMEREVSRLESQLIDAETSGKADLIQCEITRKLNILEKARGE